jgi:hypothetical protein
MAYKRKKHKKYPEPKHRGRFSKEIHNIKITSVKKDGFWIAIRNIEYFCPFDIFYWFKDAEKKYIFKVQGHIYTIYWEELDIFLSEEIIKELSPEKQEI